MRWLWIVALAWLVACGPSPEEQELQILLAERQERLAKLQDRVAHLADAEQRISKLLAEQQELSKVRPFQQTLEDPEQMVEHIRSELPPGVTLVKASELQPGTAEFRFRRAELRLSGPPAQIKAGLRGLVSSQVRPTRLVDLKLAPKGGLFEGTATVDFYLRAWPQ
ncbi:MAG: hypothetical protein AB7S38_34155 [Vulcanimicrobiota bacterium]